MLLSTFGDNEPPEQVIQWGVGGLLVGGFGQIALFVTRATIDKVGLIFRFPPEFINNLLLLSLSLLILRVWINSNQHKYV